MTTTPTLEQQAFPNEPLSDLAHDLVGTLLVDLVERGHTLPAARKLLLAAFTELISGLLRRGGEAARPPARAAPHADPARPRDRHPAAERRRPAPWGDVELDKARLHIKASDAKSGRERWLPLGDDMVARLRTMKADSRSPLIFAAPRGGLLNHFKATYRRAVRAAGLAGTGLTVHCLRRPWASRLTESSGDLLLVQKLGGWSSLLLVQRYAHVRAGRDAAAIRAMLALRESHSQPHSAVTVVPLNG